MLCLLFVCMQIQCCSLDNTVFFVFVLLACLMVHVCWLNVVRPSSAQSVQFARVLPVRLAASGCVSGFWISLQSLTDQIIPPDACLHMLCAQSDKPSARDSLLAVPSVVWLLLCCTLTVPTRGSWVHVKQCSGCWKPCDACMQVSYKCGWCGAMADGGYIFNMTWHVITHPPPQDQIKSCLVVVPRCVTQVESSRCVYLLRV